MNHLHNWLEANVLRREAEAMISSAPDPRRPRTRASAQLQRLRDDAGVLGISPMTVSG